MSTPPGGAWPAAARGLALLALSPLLLAQGLYVRRTTLRLAEPPGRRRGISGSGPLLRLLILGDSAAAGVGASTQGTALSGQLVRTLAADFTLRWQLRARTGATTGDAIAHLRRAGARCVLQ